MIAFVSHDPRVAEVLNGPEISEECLALNGTGVIRFEYLYSVSGFEFSCYMGGKFFCSTLPLKESVLLATVHYRLWGQPGETTTLSFWDAPDRCVFNSIGGLVPIHRTEGLLTVLPGPATHPDPPPVTPPARIYPEKPTNEEANFRVRLTSASASPGDREIPIEVYIKADVEYSSAMVPVDFDERYLRLVKKEDHFPTGTVLSDQGSAIIFSGGGIYDGTGWRRIAAEGEEFHAATLYFDVLESAAGIAETSVEVVPVTGQYLPFYNDNRGGWIEVEYEGCCELIFPPAATVEGKILIQNLVLRGDADSSGELDLGDPVRVLSYLFTGGPAPDCRGASDFNLDGKLDIADPVSILSFLFLGREPPGGIEPRRVPCG